MGINDPYPTGGQGSDTTVPLDSFTPYAGPQQFAEEGEGESGGVQPEAGTLGRESGQDETAGDVPTDTPPL